MIHAVGRKYYTAFMISTYSWKKTKKQQQQNVPNGGMGESELLADKVHKLGEHIPQNDYHLM